MQYRWLSVVVGIVHCTMFRFQSGSFYTMPNLRRLEMQLTAAHLNLSLATLLRENAALSHLVRSIFPGKLYSGFKHPNLPPPQHLHLAEDLILASEVVGGGGRSGGMGHMGGGVGGGRDGRGWVLRHQLQDELPLKLDQITVQAKDIVGLHPVAFKVGWHSRFHYMKLRFIKIPLSIQNWITEYGA